MMKTPQRPQDNNDDAANDKIQKRLDNLYSKQELPSHASISEVEAMKARISELEAELKQDQTTPQPQGQLLAEPKPALTPTQTTPRAKGVKFSIQSKMTLWAGLCLVLATTVLVAYSVITLRNTAIEAAQKEAVAITEGEASNVLNELNPALVAADTLAKMLGAVKDPENPIELTREQANGILRKVAEENPTFLGTWTIWERNAFDGLDAEYRNTPLHDGTGRFIPYWVRTSPDTVEGVALIDYETPGLNDWYAIPRETRKDVVLPPFFYAVDGVDVMMTSLAVPIIENDRFYGVAGVDYRIDFVQSVVNEIHLYDDTAEAVLFTNGVLIAVHNQPELALQPASSVFENFDQIQPDLNTNQTVISQSISGEFLYVISPISFGESNTLWYFGLIIPFEKITEASTTAALHQVLIGLGLLAAALVLLWLLTGQVVRPIQSLTSVASTVAQGNLDVVANVNSNDEIGVLAGVFNSMLYQLRDLFATLEQRVAERTHDLELATEVGRAISEKIGNLQDLLTQSVELIRSNYKLYYTQLYLLDASGRNLVLRAGTGEAGKQLLQRGHRLAVSASSLNSRAASTQKPVLVGDTQKNSNFLPNPLLPNTRSELAVPLIFNGKVIGVLDMQSDKPETFSEANIPAFEVLTGQLAVAIQNSILFKQTEESRLLVQEQARRLTSSGWHEFLNAVDRSESLGYVFNQEEVLPIIESQETPFENKLVVPIQVTGTDVGEIQLAGEANRQWSSNETQIVQAAMEQVGQHIENLRLLAQADRYRAEAELVSRRLTHQGWETFLQTRGNLASGYSYNLNEIKPLDKAVESDVFFSQTRPITVREETIGELSINAENVNLDDVNEIFSAVATQLGDHIENLRLIEETQQRTLDLEESQTFLDSVVENLPTMLFVKDAEDLRFVRFNKAAEELTGFGRESLLSKNDHDFFSKEEADFFTSNDRQVLISGQILDTPEEQISTVHHGTRYLHTRKVPIYGKDGKAKYLLGVSEDITERKHDQEILAQRANQLETVATLSSTASTVLDPDELLQAVVDLTKERFNMYHTHIYLANESWKTLLLAAGAGEVGRQMIETGHAIEMDVEKSLVARASRERKAIIVNDVRSEAGFLPNPMLPETRAEIAVPMIVGDKVIGVFDVQSNIAGHFSAEDAHIYTILASQVAVALQNARLYVEQAATVTQLRELDRLKSSFLANMSHELRTPLNSILGFADVMLEELDGPLTENMNTDLGLIHKNGQHLLHLINDVLDMAKIESGTMNLNVEKFILHDVIDEVTSITSSLASEKTISLFIEPDSDHNVEINADKIRLRQVMINLVNNAMKFTEKGKISIRAIRENDQVLIAVKDMGIGIPPEQLESVFQEFTQVDTTTTRKAGGTGLGLPISRRLIQMHSGRLWAESTGVDGEGATFYVQLPIEANINEGASVPVK